MSKPTEQEFLKSIKTMSEFCADTSCNKCPLGDKAFNCRLDDKMPMDIIVVEKAVYEVVD